MIGRLISIFRLIVATILMLAGILITLCEILATHFVMVTIIGKPQLGLRIKQMFAGSYCFMAGFVVEKVMGIRINFTGDQLPPQENVLLISNHVSFWDQFYLYPVASRCDRISSVRIFTKEEIRNYWPWGTCMYYVSYVFIKRNWTSDISLVKKAFENIWNMTEVPVWLLLFAEGRRITPKRLQDAQAFAQEKNLPVLRHLQYPRYKGFSATINHIRPLLDSVYDVTMAFPDNNYPSIVGFLTGNYAKEIHYHVRRYPVSELPESVVNEDLALRDWVYQLWLEKDELLEEFHSKGEFPEPKLVFPHGNFMKNMNQALEGTYRYEAAENEVEELKELE